jgi:hypothetical protein
VGLFIRLTVLIAFAIVALVVVALLIKTLFVAALVAALVVGAMFAVNFVRRLSGGPGPGPLVPR